MLSELFYSGFSGQAFLPSRRLAPSCQVRELSVPTTLLSRISNRSILIPY